MALLIVAAVAPGLRVVQIAARLGIPPVTPARLQSIVRRAAASESTIVWAGASDGKISTPTTSRRDCVHFIQISSIPGSDAQGDVVTFRVRLAAGAAVVMPRATPQCSTVARSVGRGANVSKTAKL